MSDILQNELKEIIGRIIKQDLSNYQLDDINSKNFKTWDSTNSVKIVLTLEDYYKITFNNHEMQNMLNLKSILEILERKNVFSK